MAPVSAYTHTMQQQELPQTRINQTVEHAIRYAKDRNLDFALIRVLRRDCDRVIGPLRRAGFSVSMSSHPNFYKVDLKSGK